MNNYWKHFKTVMKHKIEVGKVCFKFGLYRQGIVHDLSKFSYCEFAPSARYFQGTSSPIDAEKIEKGYSAAWLHHKAKNKHHPWYWMDWDSNQDPTPCKIPEKYVYEMIADWIGAGKVYGGKEWTQDEPYRYYKEHNRTSKSGFPIWHFATRAMIDTILVDLKEEGLDFVAERVKNKWYFFKFYANPVIEGKEIMTWIPSYHLLVEKYYMEDNND